MTGFSTVAVDLARILPGGDNGGSKIFTLELIRNLAQLSPNVQFVLLTAPASHEELAMLDTLNVSRCLITNTDLAAGREYMVLDSVGADLLFCPLTALTFLHPNKPAVSVVFDLQHVTHPEFFRADDRAFREQSVREVCRHASAIGVISEYARKSVLKHGSVEPERVFTIPIEMAYRLRAVDEVEASATLQRGGLIRGRFLLYPANFWPHKNHEKLLTAFSLARSTGEMPNDMKLACTGAPGNRMKELQDLARRMDISGTVAFLGFLSDEEFRTVLQHAGAVVFPSLYEGFGMPILEAMAAGCPVACSNRTSLPEVAGGAALLFDPSDPASIARAIIQITTHETTRKKLQEAGRQRAKELCDPLRMARKYLEIFRFACEHPRTNTLAYGIHSDGWIGPSITLHYQKGATNRFFEAELYSPPWSPIARSEIAGFNEVGDQISQGIIERGHIMVMRFPIESHAGSLEIRVGPTFNPAASFFNQDNRDLSVMVSKLELRADNSTVTLLPPSGLVRETELSQNHASNELRAVVQRLSNKQVFRVALEELCRRAFPIYLRSRLKRVVQRMGRTEKHANEPPAPD